MMNTFIWTDLSTYHLKESVSFYEATLNWKFKKDNNYFIGGNEGMQDVGIYETPEFFKKIGMPHFWMNYIKVKDLNKIESKSEAIGGKIELSNQAFNGGRISLIRDPMGAGFTVYEGSGFDESLFFSSRTIGLRELHTSNIKVSKKYYETLFEWHLEGKNDKEFSIKNHKGVVLGNMQEINNAKKGKYEYWVTEFKVMNIENVSKKISQNGGLIISQERNRMLVTDNFKEAFFYISPY